MMRMDEGENAVTSQAKATSVIEISLSNILRLPVSPVLFRLLRIGKLARAIRMVTMSFSDCMSVCLSLGFHVCIKSGL